MGGCFSKKGDQDGHGFQSTSPNNREASTAAPADQSDKPLPQVPEEPAKSPTEEQIPATNEPIVRDFARERSDSLEITPAPPIGGYPDDYTARDLKVSGRATGE